jgi:nicotinate-nucleotide adenylyltransferase
VKKGARVGILGGTFDPIHRAHVNLALTCLAECALDEVRLVTASVPPHKRPPEANAFHRHAMVALAASHDERLVADPRELLREGPSYTIDTLEDMGRELEGAELFLLLGADSLRDLPTWRRWQDVVEAAVIVSTGRAGLDLDPIVKLRETEIPPGRWRVVRHEPPPWSSTELRSRLHAGASCKDALDPLVASYIARASLYARPADATHPARSAETTT